MSAHKRYCLTLDLKDDPEKIAEYEAFHSTEKFWPEIAESIFGAGIISMEIYRLDTRMFMIMEVDESFSFERKAQLDQENPKVQEWETLMWEYQNPLKGSAPGEKWKLMDQIFDLRK